MGGERSADGGARGGERIQAARARSRLILGGAAVAAAGGLAVYALVASADLRGLTGGLAAAAVLVLAAALVRGDATATTAALVGLGAAWSVSAWTRGLQAPAGTAVAAAALVGVAELAFAALEQTPVPDEGELVARRFAGSFGRAAGALALAGLLLAALALPAHGGLALEAVGVAAAVAILGLLLSLAHESEARER